MKILIVDDNQDSRMILRSNLERDGHYVEEAVNGVEALEIAGRSLPEMIISDILMPEMDGFVLCRKVKEDERLYKIPFIFYTATYVDPEDERLAISLGASRFIVKPVEIDEFLNIIKEGFREYEENRLPLHERLLKDDSMLSMMYEKSIAHKLDNKVRELNLYKQIFTTATDAIAIISPDGHYISQNASHLALLGYSDEELRGKTPAIQFGEKAFAGILGKLTEKGEYSGEIMGRTKDGDNRCIELSVFAIREEKDNVKNYIAIEHDMTGRKQAEKALQVSEEKYSKAFRSSPTFITITTLSEGRFIEVNDAFLEKTGYGREEVIGRSSSAIGMWAEPAERGRIMSLLKEHKIVNNQEVKFRIKTGEVLTVLWSAEMIDIESDQCVLAVAQDVTDRKKLEEQLLQSQKMEAVGQLAGGVAHDFNNILTAIISYAYMLKKSTKEDESAMNNVEKILELSDRAANITRGLLTFSRKQYFELVPVNLNDIIRRDEKLLTQFLTEDIRLRTKLADRDLTILADKTQIEQVIVNLATNARDAMPGGGEFVLETGRVEIDEKFIKSHGFGKPGRFAVLCVTDTGTGMNEEVKQKIFEPFFTTKEVGKGSGLGLAIAYGIIKQHNGFINVYSEQGKGTTFRIYLPEIKARPVEEKEEVLPDLRGQGETILVAEDEPAVRDSMKTILKEFGYNVIEAVNGADALEKFKQDKHEIRLLVLDVVMPEMNGKEAYEEIKRLSPDIKAIFTSGYTADIIEKKTVLDKDAVFISKPILPNKLLLKIREALD